MQSRILLRSRWSNAAYESAFRSQYESIGQSLVGYTILPCKDGNYPGGVLHWRACLGVICLHEESIDQDLVDNSAHFRYGDSNIGLPISVQADFSYLSSGEKVCHIKILVKDASICLVNLSSSGEKSLLSGFVNLAQGHTIDILSEKSLTQSTPNRHRGNWTSFLNPEESDLSVTCGCMNSEFAAVGLPDGRIACYDLFTTQEECKIVGKRVITVSNGENNMNIFQKWFSVPAVDPAQAAHSKALLSLQCTGGGLIIALLKSGRICIVDRSEGVVVEELDFLHMLQKQYPVLAGDISVEDSVMTLCEDALGVKDTSTTPFAIGYCVKVTGAGGVAHLEWHVVVLILAKTGGAVWRVVDYGNVYAPLSHSSLLDLHMSRQSNGTYQLDSKWRNESERNVIEDLLINTTFHDIDSSPSIALQCSSRVTKLDSDNRELELDSSISSIIKSNGGWRSGINRYLSVDEATVAVKMIRLQRLFRPGRFALSTVVDTLMHDVPVPLALELFQSEEFSLSLVIKLVCGACEEWARLKMEGGFDDFDDNLCENFAEYLDLSMAEFTKLCHVRKMSEQVKSSRGSLGVIANARGSLLCGRCGNFSLISDHYSLTLVPIPEYTSPHNQNRNSVIKNENIDEMLGFGVEGFDIKVLQLINEAVPKESFEELDILFSKFCLESPEIDSKILSWVIQQGNTMASNINDDVENELLRILSDGGALADILNRLDSLLVISIGTTWIQAERIPSANVFQTVESSFISSLEESTASRLVEKEFELLSRILVLFSHLCSARYQAPGNVTSEVQSIHLPRIVHSFVYVGFIRWSRSLRPPDSTDLRRLFDLDDLFPSSHAFSQRRPSPRNFIDNCILNQSVFGNFWKSLNFEKMYPPGIDQAQRYGAALGPSCCGTFTQYLLKDGNFSCLRRLAGLLDIHLDNELGRLSFIQSSAERIESLSFAIGVLRSRIRTMAGIAVFYESLRIYATKSRNDIEISRIDEDKLKESFENLLQTFPSVDDRVHIALSEKSKMPVGDNEENRTTTQSTQDNIKIAISHLTEGLAGKNAPLIYRDAIACLEDAAIRIVDESAIIREAASIYSLDGSLAVMFAHNDSFFRRIFAINHIKDILEVAKRARVVLPHTTGSEMSLRGNYLLTNFIKETMDIHGDLLDSHLSLNKLMMDEYINSWGRIFNASLESYSLDEALSAIIRMIELADEEVHLDNLGLTEPLDDKLVQPWQVCVRSLVALACECGELQWLCNVPEVKIGLVSITDSIVAELSRLSKSRKTVRALSSSGKPTEINYGECLFCFQFSRGFYRDAATALYDYTNRLSIFGGPWKMRKGSTHIELSYRSRALAACLSIFSQMEQNQAFLLTHTKSSKIVNCVTPLDLEYEFLCLCAADRIKHASSNVQHDFECLIVALCETGDWASILLALTLCHRTMMIYKKSPGINSFEVAPQGTLLRCACQAVDAFVSMSEDDVSTQKILFIDEYAPYIHACDPISEAPAPLRFLIDTLQVLDSGEWNWALHRTAAKKILTLRASCAALPETLRSSFLSKQGSTTGLLSLLIECGHLREACNIASHIVETASTSFDQQFDKQSHSHIPYELLDRLFIAANKTINKFNPATDKEKDDLRDLRESLESLEKLVLSFFRKRTAI